MQKEALDKSGFRNFGVMTALIIVLIFGLLITWVFNIKLSIRPWVLSTIFLTWAFNSFNFTQPLNKLWSSYTFS